MIPPNNAPRRPSGNSAFALFCQWVWDWITKRGRLISVPGQIEFSYTDAGIIPSISPSPGGSGGQPYPFKIVRGSTWLKFKVKPGLYINTGNPLTITNLDTELTLTANVSKYWIVIDMTTTGATISTSSTTPTWSVSKLPIGYVDTDTYAADERTVIQQIQRTDIVNPCLT